MESSKVVILSGRREGSRGGGRLGRVGRGREEMVVRVESEWRDGSGGVAGLSERGSDRLRCGEVVWRGVGERRSRRERSFSSSSSSSSLPTSLLPFHVHRPPQLLLFLLLHASSLERCCGIHPVEVGGKRGELLDWRSNEDGRASRRGRVVSSDRRTIEGCSVEEGESLGLEIRRKFVEPRGIASKPGNEELRRRETV